MMGAKMSSSQLIAQDPAWTKQDFLYRIDQIAMELKNRNIQKCGFYFDDAALLACTLLACFRANVTVLLPPNLLAENKQWLDENSAYLFTDKDFTTFGISHKIENPSLDFPYQSQSEVWLKTSGSSGNAKIITKNVAQMWAEGFALQRSLPLRAEDNLIVLGSVSPQHCYGLSFRVMYPLVMGWQIGRSQLPYPEFLLAESEKYQHTLWISSPALLTHWQIPKHSPALSTIKGIVSAAGVLPETTATYLSSHLTCPIIEIYGSTETGAIAMRLPKQHWQPLPSIKLGLNQEALWVEGDWMTGRQQTADAVEFYEDGFALMGRIDRIVKLGDKRISLAKIENHLFAHSLVSDCYVAQHPVKARPAAWVALSAEGQALLQQQGKKAVVVVLQNYLNQREEKFAIPRFWRFCEKLPRNSQSKILKKDFDAIFSQQDETTQ